MSCTQIPLSIMSGKKKFLNFEFLLQTSGNKHHFVFSWQTLKNPQFKIKNFLFTPCWGVT